MPAPHGSIQSGATPPGRDKMTKLIPVKAKYPAKAIIIG